MKLNFKTGLTLALLCATALFSCKKDQDEFIPGPEKATLVLSGEITKNTELTPDNNYVLKGRVFVKGNVALTIAAGTTIMVEPAEKMEDKGALIITRGAKINVNGDVEKPVVFTSAAAKPAPGDWVGLIVLGKAATNGAGGVMHIAGMEETPDTEFGGVEENDNSGSIKFLRLEYTGALNPENEEEWAIDHASGLMLGGVGSGTTLENVMVKHSRDDGFQFVGGKVNGKFLISYDNGDDNFDFDRGYTGRLQFVISYRPSASKAGIRANGVESLNDKDATEVLPYTHPVISNMTIIGPAEAQPETDQSQGVYIRKNTRFTIQNSIIAGYTYGGLMLCPKTKPYLVDNSVQENSEFRYNLVNADNEAWAFNFDSGPSGVIINPDADVANWATQTGNKTTKTRANNNELITDIAGYMFGGLYQAGAAPDFRPQVGSPALKGANFSSVGKNKDMNDMSPVTYRGALGTTDSWANTGSWANWD
ncbi:hypothetical protein ACTHQF_02325 [Pedobacter sp. SAFR-022]|uniref:hypothetical protein n=1 Tax=Pedobacter sp. SAFR-022 TaxID=3436861 RepID=UPI003F7CE004